MKAFKDYTIDQQNDLNMFATINYDFETFKFYFDRLIRSTSMDDEIAFHNNLVKARDIMDEIINIVKFNEDKH